MAGDAGDPAPARSDVAGSKRGLAHVTTPVVAVAQQLPRWVELVRAPNPGPMTLEGTNTWVLRTDAGRPAVVVDPGPADEGHLRAAAAGGVAGVLITHGHPDHVEGLARFQALTGAPVIDPAGLPAQWAGLAITAISTPGHTADSVCYLVAFAGEQVILTGDTILGRGTTVVAWPDGDLGEYLASLGQLTDYSLLTLPGHGPPLVDCAAAAEFYLAHRRARLDQVRAAVAGGAATPAEVVAVAYPDLDPMLAPAAEWSVRAQLAYLAPPGSAQSEPSAEPRRESRPAVRPLDSP